MDTKSLFDIDNDDTIPNLGRHCKLQAQVSVWVDDSKARRGVWSEFFHLIGFESGT